MLIQTSLGTILSCRGTGQYLVLSVSVPEKFQHRLMKKIVKQRDFYVKKIEVLIKIFHGLLIRECVEMKWKFHFKSKKKLLFPKSDTRLNGILTYYVLVNF